MPFTATATTTTYLTPDDAVAARAALLAVLNAAQETIRILCYGFTDLQLLDALAAAHLRGVDVKLVLDHSQSTGGTEALALHRLLMTLPAQNVRIGTSPVGHQIMHLKVAVIDGLQVTSGSLNWSLSAFSQANNLDLAVSADRASAFAAMFDELWAYISTHEAAYQIPVGQAPTPPVAPLQPSVSQL